MAATAERHKMDSNIAKLPVEEGPRSFAVFLSHAFDGEAERELSLEMQQLLDVMRASAITTRRKRKGKITLELDFEVTERSETTIEYGVKIKKPKPVRAPCTAWVTEGGNAVFEQPKQTKLPFRDVNTDAAPRDANATAAVRDV